MQTVERTDNNAHSTAQLYFISHLVATRQLIAER